MSRDAFWLERTAELSRKGMARGEGGPFGALIVRGSEVLAEGWNRVLATHDPTAHAEINVIRAAAARLGSFHLPDCTLYTSCEPCPMCLAAIYWARIPRVVYANTRQQADAIGFSDLAIYQEIALDPGARSIAFKHLPSAAAEAAFQQWSEKEDKHPY